LLVTSVVLERFLDRPSAVLVQLANEPRRTI